MSMNLFSKLFFGGLLLITGFSFAADNVKPADVFSQANAAYEKEDFAAAENSYSALVAQGFGSAELYYNLANVYYRKGERGRAVLWYERALEMAPRDADIQFNLSLAQSHIKENQPDPIQAVVLYFTANELGAVCLLLVWVFFILAGCVLLGVVQLGTGTRLALSLTGVLMLIVGAWFGFNVSVRRDMRGVIVAPPGEVRNGPGVDYAVGFTIPEGSNVLVLNKRPDWVQIGIPQQGLKGWLPATEVELITSAS